MYNDLFSIGPLTFHTYGLMTAIGILAAYFSAEYRAKKKKLDFEQIFGIVIFCVLFGYAGSKLLFYLTILPDIMADPSIILRSFSGGWVVFGGLLGGIFGGWLYCHWKKLSSWKYFDIGMPSVALAQGFGRIGCFFAGCCYGVEHTPGITFTHSHYAPNGVSLVPTQLISSAGDFLLFGFLVLYDKKWKKKDGEVTGLYLILYSLGRFIIEFWRGDVERGQVGPLSTSQFIGLFTVVAGLIVYFKRRNSKEVIEAVESVEATGSEAVAEATTESETVAEESAESVVDESEEVADETAETEGAETERAGVESTETESVDEESTETESTDENSVKEEKE